MLCDHGTVEGALRLQEMAPFITIVGEEILTPVGEVMGLFLQQTIPSGIMPLEAIERIREQGGLVCIPHPLARYRSSAMKEGAVEEIISEVDIIETFNAHTLPFQDLSRSRRLACRYNLPQSAGSDAHSASEIGDAYVALCPFHNQAQFLENLRGGQIHGHRSSLLRRIVNRARRLGRKQG